MHPLAVNKITKIFFKKVFFFLMATLTAI